LQQERHAALTIELDASGPSGPQIRRRLGDARLSIVKCDVSVDTLSKRRKLGFELREFGMATDIRPLSLVDQLASEAGVVKLQWRA
jgi:hypothetical protein